MQDNNKIFNMSNLKMIDFIQVLEELNIFALIRALTLITNEELANIQELYCCDMLQITKNYIFIQYTKDYSVNFIFEDMNNIIIYSTIYDADKNIIYDSDKFHLTYLKCSCFSFKSILHNNKIVELNFFESIYYSSILNLLFKFLLENNLSSQINHIFNLIVINSSVSKLT